MHNYMKMNADGSIFMLNQVVKPLKRKRKNLLY